MHESIIKVEVYFPLTVWDNQEKLVRRLNKAELDYEKAIIEQLTKRFGAITITEASGTYIRDDKVIMTKSDILAIFIMNDTKDEHEDLNYIEAIAYKIKEKLNQESVLVTIDTSVKGVLL